MAREPKYPKPKKLQSWLFFLFGVFVLILCACWGGEAAKKLPKYPKPRRAAREKAAARVGFFFVCFVLILCASEAAKKLAKISLVIP